MRARAEGPTPHLTIGQGATHRSRGAWSRAREGEFRRARDRNASRAFVGKLVTCKLQVRRMRSGVVRDLVGAVGLSIPEESR